MLKMGREQLLRIAIDGIKDERERQIRDVFKDFDFDAEQVPEKLEAIEKRYLDALGRTYLMFKDDK